MSNQMNKINKRIQEYIDNYQPEIKPDCGKHTGNGIINRLKRNRAKRLSKKLMGAK